MLVKLTYVYWNLGRVLEHTKDMKPRFVSPRDVVDVITNAVQHGRAEANFD